MSRLPRCPARALAATSTSPEATAVPAGREASSYEYADLASVIAQSGSTPTYDATSDSWHLAYQGADGLSHDAWYPQADTIGRRLQLARDHGLGGVGFWAGKADHHLEGA